VSDQPFDAFGTTSSPSHTPQTGPVLCLACGMRVLTLADGSCPSCGAHGQVATRASHHGFIHTLVPEHTEEPTTGPHYACLYLRPFATRFRAAGRMQAIARAMRPFGGTVALHASEELLGLRPVDPGPVLKAIMRVPRLGLLVSLPLLVWNLSLLLLVLVLRLIFRWQRLELIDVQDDRWRAKFRQLALHSHLIVMDASARTAGVLYETEFIADLELSGRLILLHNRTPTARLAAERHVKRLQALNVSVPLVPYSIWNLSQLTSDLAAIACGRLSDSPRSVEREQSLTVVPGK
jgi:hypothetical protein